MGKITVSYREDVVAALDEDGRPLRAEVRDILTRQTRDGKVRGAVLNLAASWAGRRVVVIEVGEEPRKGRKAGLK